MTWLQYSGIVLVGWLWIVCGAVLFSIVADWLDHRRDSNLRRAARLIQLWKDGLFKRVL